MAITLKKTLLWLTIAFVIVLIYRNPYEASNDIGTFLGSVGRLFITLVEQAAKFLTGLTR